jgi:hypothetical protein
MPGIEEGTKEMLRSGRGTMEMPGIEEGTKEMLGD